MVPEKQGLKQEELKSEDASKLGLSSGSRKTRIETLWCGQLPGVFLLV